MKGMNRVTGKPVSGAEHLAQSIRDLLTTPIGSRVMLREYGSRIPELVDRPTNALLDVELHAAVAEALARWEPRFRLTSVQITERTTAGRITISIEGVVVADGRAVRLEGITV
jgi:uncharacterized protein